MPHEFDVVVASRTIRPLPIGQHLVWDVTTSAPQVEDCAVVIHAATPASAELNSRSPAVMFWTNVRAMENVIRLAESFASPPKIVFTSSGGVYGEMPGGIDRFPEGFGGAASCFDLRSAYAEGKRAAEFLLTEATHRGVCVGVVARLFAFSGIHLPLDRRFSVGNFVCDPINHGVVTVSANGKSLRSYLDVCGMASWILKIDDVGEPGFANQIGSE